MIRPRIIPTLLLKNNGLVKTKNFKNPSYVGDPINAVKLFNELCADELVFLDIDASKEKRIPSLELLTKIGDEAYMPFAVGGGISNIEEIKQILKCGAEKVVLNSQAIFNDSFLKQAVATFGSSTITVCLDIKYDANNQYEVFTNNGTQKTQQNPINLAIKMEKLGVGELIIQSIDRDGTKSGYDQQLIKNITELVRIPVVALGGCHSYENLAEAFYESGASAVSAGSLFVYVGSQNAVLINYPDAQDIKELFSKNI